MDKSKVSQVLGNLELPVGQHCRGGGVGHGKAKRSQAGEGERAEHGAGQGEGGTGGITHPGLVAPHMGIGHKGLQGNLIPPLCQHKVQVILSWSSAHQSLWQAFFGGRRCVWEGDRLAQAGAPAGGVKLSLIWNKSGVQDEERTTTQVESCL